MYVDIAVLTGKILKEIVQCDDEIRFTTTDGEEYRMMHVQDCCESVTIEDIDGDLKDLIGDEILVAEERTFGPDDEDAPELGENEYLAESCTWTFYKIATINHSVVIRWFGESNGYYSEGVDFVKMDKS
jgi:hypothetical protein